MGQFSDDGKQNNGLRNTVQGPWTKVKTMDDGQLTAAEHRPRKSFNHHHLNTNTHEYTIVQQNGGFTTFYPKAPLCMYSDRLARMYLS